MFLELFYFPSKLMFPLFKGARGIGLLQQPKINKRPNLLTHPIELPHHFRIRHAQHGQSIAVQDLRSALIINLRLLRVMNLTINFDH
jgi:hypothetical protein